MKRLALLLFLLLLPLNSYGFGYFDDGKVTQIKGIILICNSTKASKCDDRWFSSYITASPIKFISRQRFDEIIGEQKLASSGMTKEENAKIGQLSNASHFLFYTNEGFSDVCVLKYHFKLVSTSTSEIEYVADTCECTDYYREKLKKEDEAKGITFFSPAPGWYCNTQNVEGFFKLLSNNGEDLYIRRKHSPAPWRIKK